MKAAHPTSSETQATTTASHLRATAAVGGALIGYLVMKTPQARARLELLASQAELTASDAAVVAAGLAKPARTASYYEA